MARDDESLIISRAEDALGIAKRGLRDLNGDDLNRRRLGLYDVAIHGRPVTNILQQIRSNNRDAFNNWYQRYKDEMRHDELMRFFVDLRNEFEKEGDVSTRTTIKINHLDFPSDIHNLGPRPANTKAFVIDNDGAAWITEDDEGREVVHHIQAPKRMVDTKLSVENPPMMHLGVSAKGKDIAELSQLYLEYLDRLLADAKRHFLSESATGPQG